MASRSFVFAKLRAEPVVSVKPTNDSNQSLGGREAADVAARTGTTCQRVREPLEATLQAAKDRAGPTGRKAIEAIARHNRADRLS